ncbi:hypothetical protein [Telmatospirillum sp.]|uniref:hypothetical protein n=1 Tax=Telmatospirillum sp. TaxID=2079197 RepID=UPI00283BA6F2|nr:hypothetical protein [Telmatospirillum sp.]MDR3439975.1 hypothetical protein [Telmatospirillum sp.]
MVASKELIDAIVGVWKTRPPGPESLTKSPAMIRLFEVCKADYPDQDIGAGPGWAITTALRSLGLPCELPSDHCNLALPAEDAAQRLDYAFRARSFRRRHLAPLDLADEFPDLDFGSAKVRTFSPDELREAFDAARLKRCYPAWDFDAGALSQFRWIVVEEDVPVEKTPEVRNLPFFFETRDQDFGRIVPHEGKFAPPLETAIFFLALAPWEKWLHYPGIVRCGFRVPWSYTVNEDLFVRVAPPPAADTLSWEWKIFHNRRGEDEEIEVPVVAELEEGCLDELLRWNQSVWQSFEHARTTPLFETPIQHFFIRALMAEKIDEFIAYMTAIEAAIGLHGDYNADARSTPDPHKGLQVTKGSFNNYRYDLGFWGLIV